MVDERFEVRPQELPADPAPVVLLVDADVTAPDHLAPEPFGVLGQPSGLWVVQHHDVAVARMGGERIHLRPQRVDVDVMLVLTEIASVACSAIEVVVQALGDLEELRVPVDDEPTCVHADPSDQTEQDVQHLGHAATRRGRVHVDHTSTTQSVHCLLGRLDGEQIGPVIADHRREAKGVARRDGDVFHDHQFVELGRVHRTHRPPNHPTPHVCVRIRRGRVTRNATQTGRAATGGTGSERHPTR